MHREGRRKTQQNVRTIVARMILFQAISGLPMSSSVNASCAGWSSRIKNTVDHEKAYPGGERENCKIFL